MLRHNIMVFQFCRPVWNRWLELATLSGKLSAISKETSKEVKWIAHGFDWVGSVKRPVGTTDGSQKWI